MDTLKISLSVVLMILLIYACFATYVIFSCKYFKKLMDSYLLSNKLLNQLLVDDLNKLYLELDCAGASYNKIDLLACKYNIQSGNIDGLFTELISQINDLLSNHSNDLCDETIRTISIYAKETANLYQNINEKYDFCLKGYTYWIHFWMTRPIILILKFKDINK